ncbi:hypothetical protein I352_05518 [Cryptococcus deuterogattii MMRL2647]|nr:hypothetical protein I352_05518 [Cryptococcus deuterogattii MMRL2647]
MSKGSSEARLVCDHLNLIRPNNPALLLTPTLVQVPSPLPFLAPRAYQTWLDERSRVWQKTLPTPKMLLKHATDQGRCFLPLFPPPNLKRPYIMFTEQAHQAATHRSRTSPPTATASSLKKQITEVLSSKPLGDTSQAQIPPIAKAGCRERVRLRSL